MLPLAVRTTNFKLGLFVIVAVALGVVSLVVLGAGALLRETYTFETYMTESVQGLEVGAPVKIRGVQLGKVSRIAFVDSKYRLADLAGMEDRIYSGLILVEFAVDREYFDRRGMKEGRVRQRVEEAVGAGLRARMASSGLTGPPFIAIELMDPAEYPPMELAWEPTDMYVPSAPSTLSQFVHAAESILKDVRDADVKAIAADLRNLLEELDTKVGQIKAQELSDEAVALAAELRETNAKVQAVLDSEQIKRAIDQVPVAVEGVPKAVESINAAVADIRRLARRVDAVVVSQRDDIEAVIANLRQITDNLEVLSENMKDAPSQVIFGQPPPPPPPDKERK